MYTVYLLLIEKKGIFNYPHFLTFYLQMSKESFIISVEGNGDIGVSPLP